VHEVAVDGGKVGATGQGIDQVLAHPHQRLRTAGREVEAPQQLLPAWFRRRVHTRRGGIRRAVSPRFDSLGEPLVIGAEFRRERLEERNPGA
jgi:hypothetical protein